MIITHGWRGSVIEQMKIIGPLTDPTAYGGTPSRWHCWAPAELVGIHTNMPATVPDDIAAALGTGGPPPSGLSADETLAYDQLDTFYKHGLGYAQEMSHRPQTLYALADSPVGLAA